MKRKLSTYLGLALVLAVGGIATFAALFSISTPGSAEATSGDNLAGITGEARLGNTLVDLAPVTTAVTSALTVTQTPVDPGTSASYTAQFSTPRDLSNSIDKIIFTLDEEFAVPATIDRNNVSISASLLVLAQGGEPNEAVTPLEVSVSRVGTASDLPEITLTIPDMATGSEAGQAGGDDIRAGATITVIFRQSAGIKNPTEGGSDPWKVRLSNPGGAAAPASEDVTFNMVTPFLVELGSDDGKRGDKVTVVGKGVEGSTTSTFWRDGNGNGARDAGEIDLCSALTGSDDIATCTFTVNNPPFVPAFGTDNSDTDGDLAVNSCDIDIDGDGILNTAEVPALPRLNGCNFINVIDGENHTATIASQTDVNNARWELEGLVQNSPNTGDPGDTVTVQLKDFPAGAIVSVRLGGVFICGSTAPACTQVVPASGELNFTIKIPNGVPTGKQTLFVAHGAGSEDADIIVGGATITPTPKTIVPNQRVSLIGSGFSEGAFKINESAFGASADPDGAGPCTLGSSLTIGGEQIHPSRINDGNVINIDAGGSWSASIDMTITTATTTEGPRELKATDCGGREGKFEIVFAPRVMTITPSEGRVGTAVRVKGSGYPAKNNDGNSITVTVTYDAGAGGTDQTTEQPDSGGNFEVELEVPSDAAIPSTNTVKTEFPQFPAITPETGSTSTVISTVTHKVPEAKASLDKDRGQPGTIVTLKAEGFKRFTSVKTLEVGDTDVTPAPKPSTDANGNVTVQFLIPGADSGVQTVKIDVGGVTASAGFTIETTPTVPVVTPPTGPQTVADALATPLGGDFVRAFNFDNQSKAWTFNDPRPDFAAINTLKEVVGGKVYWINVANDKTITFCGRSTALFKGWNQAAC